MNLIFRRCGFVCVLIFLSATLYAQIPGIGVNNVVMNAGDTVKVCRGSSLAYSYLYTTTGVSISWDFQGSTSGSFAPTVVYNTDGLFLTKQKITYGGQTDSTFIYVDVKSTKPTAAFSFSPGGVCGNVPIQFTNSSTGSTDAPIVGYSWDFKDLTPLDTSANPVHRFLNAICASGNFTNYSVVLTARNAYGCTATATATPAVQVKCIPDASVTNADPGVTTTTFNDTVTFRRCGTEASYLFQFRKAASTTLVTVNEYRIDWGDGSDTTFAAWNLTDIIKHLYPKGKKIMTVYAKSSDGCIGIKTYNVFLGSVPEGGITGPPDRDICAPSPLTFRIRDVANNPAGTKYTLSFNDGTAPIVFYTPPDSITHWYTRGSCGTFSDSYNNSFNAKLVIENPCPPPSTGTIVPVYVSSKPRSRISFSTDSVVCTGTNIVASQIFLQGGVVVALGGNLSDCVTNNKLVWSLPGATLCTPGTNLGSTNGSLVPELWTGGPASVCFRYDVPGTYQVKLLVGNRCGVDTVVRNICVRRAPVASFTMDHRQSCGKDSVVITNTSPLDSFCTGNKYAWAVDYTDPLGCGNTANPYQFINGTSATSVNVNLRFNFPGRYIVRLTASANSNNFTGCPSPTYVDTFWVRDKPKVTINAIPSVCIGNCILPKATVSNCYGTTGPAYLWSFVNASADTSTVISPGPICYQSTGKYLVTLKVENECGVTTATDSATVVTRPVANAGLDISVCSGVCDTIGTAAVSGLTYRWTPATGLSSATVARPRICLTYAGPQDSATFQYVVKVSAGDTTCSSADTVSITVKRSPQIKTVPPSTAICLGDSVKLYATTTDTATLQYVWSPATGLNTTSGDTVKASPNAATTYTVTAAMANGCVAKDTARVTIKPAAKASFIPKQTTVCTPVNIDTLITNVTSLGNGTYYWYHNGSLIATNTTGAVPSHPLTIPGRSDTIKLVVQSNGGCKPDSTQQIFITIPGVTPAFIKSVDSGCGPLPVTFTNTSSPLTNVQFLWNFGNGTASNLTQPGAITFNSNASFRDTTYYITLRADNGCNAVVFRDSVKVLPRPKARFAVDTTRGCSPFRVSIQNTSLGNGFRYYWDFGDGTKDTTITLTSFTHTYTTGSVTTFVVRLIAENTCSRDTVLLNLVVSPNTIQPRIAINGNQLIGCAPHIAGFNNGSIGATQLTWDFGDGSAPVITPNTQASVSHPYNNAGTYTVSVRLRNDCSDTSVQLQVKVLPSPASAFALTPQTVCTNQAVLVTNASSNANSYEWIWGDGLPPSSFDNGSHTYASAGNYTVALVAKRTDLSGFVCTDTSRKTVTVKDRIRARIAATPGKACAPYSLQVSADSAVGASLVEWFIYDSGGSPAVIHTFGPTAAYQFKTAGTDSVKLIVHTAAGCADSSVYRFQVNASPKATLAPVQISTCNHDTLIRFTSQVTYSGTDNVSLLWFVNGGAVGTGTPFSHRFSVPSNAVNDSTFIVRVLPQNAAGCGDSSNTAKVIIYATPVTQIDVLPSRIQLQPNYTFTFKDVGPGTHPKDHFWRMGDRTGQTRSGREVSYTYSDSGNYLVRLAVTDLTNGCSAADSVKVQVVYVPGYLYVPNAMCIGCNNNSLRQFLPLGKGLKKYLLRIYSNWGQLIFETSKLNADGSPAEAWDGTWQGKQLNLTEQNAFRWVADAWFVNGTEWNGMIYPPNQNYVKSAFITFVK